jgi:two-component system LytT family response regulator
MNRQPITPNLFEIPSAPPSAISLLRGREQVLLSDIVRLEGASNYTCFVLATGRKIMTSRNLSFYEPLLTETFVRAHKQSILNRLYITRFNRKQIVMRDGFVIQVSRRKRKEVKNFIKH